MTLHRRLSRHLHSPTEVHITYTYLTQIEYWKIAASLLDKGGCLKSHFAHLAAALLSAVGAILEDADAHCESSLLKRLYCLHPAWHDFVAVTNDAMMREGNMGGIQDILKKDIMTVWHFSHEPAMHAKAVTHVLKHSRAAKCDTDEEEEKKEKKNCHSCSGIVHGT